MDKAIRELFERYQSATKAALAGDVDIAAVSDLYDDAFIGSSPAGVMAGRKDAEFDKALAEGFARNREIGARRMEVRNLRIEPIDAMHALVHVDWRATYDKNGMQRAIDFTNAYLTRVENGKATVFGWITGDEQAALREHGII
jgi:GTPase